MASIRTSICLLFLSLHAVILIQCFSVGNTSNISHKNPNKTADDNSKSQITGTGHHQSVQQVDNVQVWDNVIPVSLCDKLHEEASKSGLGHKVFTRDIHSKHDQHDQSKQTRRPLLEQVLDDILSEIEKDNIIIQQKGKKGHTSSSISNQSESKQYVEYWTRQEWRHIEAHADVDEHLAKEQDTNMNHEQEEHDASTLFRYPANGHVLYLKVGTQVHGPTCVFPNQSSGGEILKSDGNVKLVTVPVVSGRLLRFRGDMLHAVPRPTDLWFRSFVKGAPEYTPEEDWGRSVILFNTWVDEPPKDVPLGATVSNSIDDNGKNESVNEISTWNEIFSLTLSKKDNVCATDTNEEQKPSPFMDKNAKVWLLGNERRRGYPLRTIKLKTSEEMRDALYEKYSVSETFFSQ
mmetsp:Transcript_24283/g.27747  ORF Transcript_24283/g.27747 Transcript_24283/m.27747 type:complete len:405 (+) Transcript_24283:58-1272(+)